MYDACRQVAAASLAFSMTFAGWLASVLPIDRAFVDWGAGLSVTGFWVLATVFTMLVLCWAVRSMVGMYRQMLADRDAHLADRDAHIVRLEQELREERARSRKG